MRRSRFHDIVISEMPWHPVGGRRSRIPASRGSSCASRTPSGAPSSRRAPSTTPCPGVGRPCPNGFATSRSLMRAKSSASRSRARRSAHPQGAPRAGSGGASPRRSVAPLRDAANLEREALHMKDLNESCKPSTKPGQLHPRSRARRCVPPRAAPRTGSIGASRRRSVAPLRGDASLAHETLRRAGLRWRERPRRRESIRAESADGPRRGGRCPPGRSPLPPRPRAGRGPVPRSRRSMNQGVHGCDGQRLPDRRPCKITRGPHNPERIGASVSGEY